MGSYKTIGRIDDALELEGIPYVVVGGTVTAALADPHTQIDVYNRHVTAAESSDTDVIRPNGTRRDADLLILSKDKELVDFAGKIATKASQGELVISAFGFQEHNDRRMTRLRRMSALALQNFTSSRLQRPDGTISHCIYPYDVVVPNSVFNDWSMRLPNEAGRVNILDPRYHLLCYELRSVGGLRPKDDTPEKYHAAVSNVAQAFEGTQLNGLTQLEALRDVMHDIQNSSLIGAIKKQGAFGLKSKVVHKVEEQTWVVDTFQRFNLENSLFKRFVN
jgi:hypothetical protein